MAEAFGLATGILQVVAFGKHFVQTAHAIYESNDDGVSLLPHLQFLANDLKGVLNALQDNPPLPAAQINDIDDTALLVARCGITLQQMLDTLDKIGVPKKGSKRQATATAFKLMWKKSELESLQNRLNDFRAELNVHLLMPLIRAHSVKPVDKQDEILARLRTTKDGVSVPRPKPTSSKEEIGFGSSLVELLTEKLEKACRDEEKADLRHALASTIYRETHDAKPSSTETCISQPRRKLIQAAFISQFYYHDMYDRESGIPEAHIRTFRWIFDPENGQAIRWSSFIAWLESNEQVYWITGKAGAGKSTLMKFLCQPIPPPEAISSFPSSTCQSRSAKYLKRWAEEKPLIIATFYFWAGGSDMQKSQKGLFFTLLHQLVQAYPDSIPFVSRERWEVLCLFNEDCKPIGEEELRQMFSRAVSYISDVASIALFVDGLDEFEGDQHELISSLENIVHSHPVKLCVASRPWLELEEAFKHKPSLQLEYLTHSDIKEYVAAKFQENGHFAQLQRRNAPLADQLFEAVAEKSSGVFLWVRFATASLVTGMTNGDRIDDFEKRLNDLPPDLEDLFARILDTLDPFYRQQTAQYFALIRACRRPPPILLFSFADETEPVRFALELDSLMGLTVGDCETRLDITRRRLNSRCKGLLEVNRGPQDGDQASYLFQPTVQYLHKTVKDYIESPKAQEILHGHLEGPQDANLKLLTANVAMLKVWDAAHRLQQDQSIPPGVNEISHRNINIDDCMYHAARSRPDHAFDVVRLLDNVQTMLPDDFFSINSGILGFRPALELTTSQETKFLCWAVQSGVLPYATAKVKKRCLVPLRRTTLGAVGYLDDFNFLDFLLPTTHWRKLKIWAKSLYSSDDFYGFPLLHMPLRSIRRAAEEGCSDTLAVTMVEALLNKGADPSYVFRVKPYLKSTCSAPWQIFLQTFYLPLINQTLVCETQGTIREVARLMINNGAPVSLKCVTSALESIELPSDKDYIHQSLFEALKELQNNS
ncbi:Fc.00g002100.m01.CDS01 [Cosmosporella sp. VM-42]